MVSNHIYVLDEVTQLLDSVVASPVTLDQSTESLKKKTSVADKGPGESTYLFIFDQVLNLRLQGVADALNQTIQHNDRLNSKFKSKISDWYRNSQTIVFTRWGCSQGKA